MKTILIVEDNEKNMKLARDVLQAKGYRTLEAVNGTEGVALALAHVPVVAFTASVTSMDRNRITDAGFNGFIGKPVNLKEFLETVCKTLEAPTP